MWRNGIPFVVKPLFELLSSAQPLTEIKLRLCANLF